MRADHASLNVGVCRECVEEVEEGRGRGGVDEEVKWCVRVTMSCSRIIRGCGSTEIGYVV